ncbi:MAG TPA: DUF308 domain-containing protein [Candidatus Saccharimonadales bacterium]
MNQSTLKDMWGALALRGMASILFGIAAVFWPHLTLVTLVYLFGAYILASGLVNLVMGLTNLNGAGDSFWSRILLLLVGVGELGIGVYLLRHPLVTFATFILLIGITLIVRGLVELFMGIFGEGTATYRVAMVFGGIIAAIVGVILLLQPARSGVAFVWVLGLYALITGPLLIALAFDAKNAAEDAPRVARGRA